MKKKHPDYPATFEGVAAQLKKILEEPETYVRNPPEEGMSKNITFKLTELKVPIEIYHWCLESYLIYKDLYYFPREYRNYKRLRSHIKNILSLHQIQYGNYELNLPEQFLIELNFLKKVVEDTFEENPNLLKNALRNFGVRNQTTRNV